MNKKEFVKAVAEKAEATQLVAEKIIDALQDVIITEVANGGNVKLSGFGSFECVEKGERNGHNPITGESIKIGAKKVPKFKFGKLFKDTVAGK